MLRIIIMLISLSWASQKSLAPTDPQKSDKLIVFLQTDKDQAFEQANLPLLRQYCQRQQIELIVKEAAKGLPTEISSTPAIVFQTAKKRLIYAGRYQEFSSIENFIRTGRFRKPAKTDFCKQNVWLKQEGRTRVMAVAKITRLAGSLPKGYNEERFAEQASQSISRGLTRYQSKVEACIAQTDRVFYLDFHPYQAEHGQVFLSLELYSQFSCIEPVYVANGLSARDWDTLFAHAAERLARQIEQTLAESEIGDALSSVSNEIPVQTWEALGLAFPEGGKTNTKKSLGLDQLQGEWTYSGVPDSRVPALSFHFQAPLERYAGEVSQLEGKVRFNEKNQLLGGEFEVEVSSLSMGMAELDEKVLKKYLKAKKFPRASFRFDLDDRPLSLNDAAQMTAIPGQLSLMGKTVELPILAMFQMISDDAGRPQLWANGQFRLKITEDFGIEGPDGPSPNRETMIFYFSLLFNS